MIKSINQPTKTRDNPPPFSLADRGEVAEKEEQEQDWEKEGKSGIFQNSPYLFSIPFGSFFLVTILNLPCFFSLLFFLGFGAQA